MQISWAARTDPGLHRSQNEDKYCARPDLGLFVVADGMGDMRAEKLLLVWRSTKFGKPLKQPQVLAVTILGLCHLIPDPALMEIVCGLA